MTAHSHILITGGCGFIGSNLIRNLLEKKKYQYISVLDNLSGGNREDLAEICPFSEGNKPLPLSQKDSRQLDRDNACRVRLIVGDIRDSRICAEACRMVDDVVHLAASTGVPNSVEDPRFDMNSNVLGTFNMLEAARLNKVDRFIFASSSAPLGECPPPVHEEVAPHPVSPYGASKLAGEAYCSAYARTFQLGTVALRFGNVYGPGSKKKTSVVARFIRQALNGETLEIYGDGSQTRDFIFVDDIVQAIEKALANRTICGEIFQIATSRETTVSEIAELVKSLVREDTGYEVTIKHAAARPGDIQRNFSDTSKAEKMLGYQPDYELGKGLALTYTYFRHRQHLSSD